MLDERLKIKDNRCFELSWKPVGLIGTIALLFAHLLLSACTDYVSKIDGQISELKTYQEENLGDETIKSSSSSKKDVSSSSTKVTELAEESSSSSADSQSSLWSGEYMTDSRDGQVYKTVKIGSQTWMAQNLNYETANSYCYNDSAKYCSKYGRLYNWAVAMDSAGMWSTNGKGCSNRKTCSPTYPVRGVCPSGWHLPTKAEFETMINAVGGESTAGKILKSTSGWKDSDKGASGNGTDDYLFSALPASCKLDDSYCSFNYEETTFLSSTEYEKLDGYHTYLMKLTNYKDNSDLTHDNKRNGYSVRCLKD